MTIRRFLFRTVVRTFEWLTMHSRPTNVCHLSLDPIEEQHVDIITVAFNNVELIRLQERFLRKYVSDKYTHIVVDNSTDPVVRKQLFSFCAENGVAYLGMPKNWLNRIGSSYSHAMALNYIYRHVICFRRPWAFGQIDHDLFPIREISLMDKLKDQPLYGPLRLRGTCWYLSAIMSFFRFEFTEGKRVDFMPVTPDKIYLDSGGGNWYDLYSRLDLHSLQFPDECIESIRKGGNRHSDSLEFFDGKCWLHTINGSCWKKIPGEDEKNSIVRQLLLDILDK